MLNRVTDIFRNKFNVRPLVVRSPGRVNIIGEHTDYNEGFVLPASIDKAIYVAVSKRNDDQIMLYSGSFNESFDVALSGIRPTKNWATYILGVVDQLVKAGYKIGGFNLAFDGDIPIGAGLSSSAAVECATVFALNELFSLGIGKMELVRVAQKAEHVYAGVMCGIMDQFASVFGIKDHVIKLDCRSLEYQYKPLKLDGIKILLFNSNVKHTHSSSEYNTRRQQCEQGVAWVKKSYPEVDSLRDVTLQMLNECVSNRDQLIFRRCKFIIDEIQRVLMGCDDLDRADIVSLGKKMFRTHEGLSKEYEVSCRELDYLVDAVRNNPSVIGARMMGGGFGGCTINLVREEAIDQLVEQVGSRYKKDMQLELGVYVAKIGQGTEIVRQNKS